MPKFTNFSKPQMEAYRAFVKMQESSRFNMASPEARQALGLTRDLHRFVLLNYSAMKEFECARETSKARSSDTPGPRA